MKTGLVLEGGAMRGMYTCGIIDIFMEHGIDFDGTVGVSAGAAFGCNIKSRQIGRPVRYNKKYCNDKRYASFSSWIKNGDLYNEEFCYGELIYKLDPWDAKTFKSNPMEFYCVCTDVETGKPHYEQLKDGEEKDIKWIRASASIPIFSRPVEIDGHKYLDGGTSDSIPLRFFEKKGYDKIVVVETQPLEYRKKKQKYMPIIKCWLHKYPKVAKALEIRHILYNSQKEYVRKQELAGNIFVIRPEKSLQIGSVEKNPEELERVYQEGRRMGLKYIEQVKNYLKG